MIPVVAAADTLFGATTRGLLIHLDYHGLIRLHWSPLILTEDVVGSGASSSLAIGYFQDVSGSKCRASSMASCSTRPTTSSAGSTR